MTALEELKSGLTITSVKGDIRQPQNYAMGRVPALVFEFTTKRHLHFNRNALVPIVCNEVHRRTVKRHFCKYFVSVFLEVRF